MVKRNPTPPGRHDYGADSAAAQGGLPQLGAVGGRSLGCLWHTTVHDGLQNDPFGPIPFRGAIERGH
jgi:hypothetical protein